MKAVGALASISIDAPFSQQLHWSMGQDPDIKVIRDGALTTLKIQMKEGERDTTATMSVVMPASVVKLLKDKLP